MPRLSVIVFIAVSLAATSARATTWDEPWTEEIMKAADSLVEVEITGDASPLSVRTIKVWAGAAVPDTWQLDGFHMLGLRSVSGGHGPAYHFDKGDKILAWVKAGDKAGVYSLPTPTSGYALIRDDGQVEAALRHSYHRMLVTKEMYLQAATAIFAHLHDQRDIDLSFLTGWVTTYLGKPPSKLDSEPATVLFFQQHVVLESLMYFGKAEHVPVLAPFVRAEVWHQRVSAARALGGIGGPDAEAALLERVASDEADFVKVIAVWGLVRMDAKGAVPRLRELQKTASTESTGFGGNLMDPRIGTSFPTVKGAIETAIETLAALPDAPVTTPDAPDTPTGENGPSDESKATSSHPGQVRGKRGGCACDSGGPGDSSAWLMGALLLGLAIRWR